MTSRGAAPVPPMPVGIVLTFSAAFLAFSTFFSAVFFPLLLCLLCRFLLCLLCLLRRFLLCLLCFLRRFLLCLPYCLFLRRFLRHSALPCGPKFPHNSG